MGIFRSCLITFFLTSGVWTKIYAESLSDLPGAVPLDLERQAASDLIPEGAETPLQPDEARKLFHTGQVQDLSTLNPKTKGLLWQDHFPQGLPDDLASLQLNRQGDDVEFLEAKYASPGRVMFVVQKRFPEGRVRVYRFLIDDRGHNILARRTLLHKIGYTTSPVARLASVRVKFEAAYKKKEFVLNRIDQEIFKDGARWISAGLDTDDEFLTFQDLIVFPDASDWYYNFSRGDMVDGVIKGQRLINSLLLPFSLTDSPESLNVMDWEGARIFNRQVIFPHEDAYHFNPSPDDARWMARRILRLSREDWAEIARSADMPVEPGLLYGEILVSRRNFYALALGLEKEFPPMAVNYDISFGDRLLKGKLVNGRAWPTYARYFAGEDPQSPLNIKEVLAFIRSKFESNLLSNAVSEFNRRFVPGTDLGFKIFDHQLDLAARQFAEFLKTRQASKVPVGVWSTNFFNGGLILAREVIPGSYMGSENTIQKADTLGFVLAGGRLFWWDGLEDRLVASARAKMSVVVTSTHLKPVQSIKNSLHEPLSDILVPMLKNSALAPVKEMLLLEERIKGKEFEDPDPTRHEEKQALLKKLFKDLFEEMGRALGTGESYILNFSVAPSLDLSVGKGLAKDAQAYLRFQESLVGVYRVHVYRQSERTVHLYINRSGYNEISAALGYKLKIPVLEAGWNWPKGSGKTLYYKFNLDSDLQRNPNFFSELRGVYAALEGSSRQILDKIKKPWELAIDFSDNRLYLNFLMFKLAQTNTANTVQVKSPEGHEAEFYRRYRARRSGVDWESLAIEAGNALIVERAPESNIRIASKSSGNPGDTVFGRSLTREVTAEARNIPGALDLENFFGGVAYRWKGWEIKRAKVEAVFDELDEMFGERLFERPDLIQTKQIQFYNIEVQIAVYRRALERLLTIGEEEVKEIFKWHSRFEISHGESISYPEKQVSPWVYWVAQDLKALRQAYVLQDGKAFNDRVAAILDTIESQLDFDGFKKFLGGKENIFVQGVVRGFRDGAENASQDLRSSTLGEIGAQDPRSPLRKLQNEIGVSAGEMLLLWLVNPL